jgi:hypothetical protein
MKGFDKAGVCHTLGVFVSTAETAAVWAWAFSELNKASIDAGGSGVQATTLLHDCVPSTFSAIASVLCSVLYHHYCSWHSITSFGEHLAKVYAVEGDLVEPDLIALVRTNKITVSTALVRQREIVLHSFNAVLLARYEEDAAVLLAGFYDRYCTVNAALVKLLSREPYNDLSAMLLCWCDTARAINAECELFFRAVRALQCTGQGGRIKMRNFAGALLLLVHTLYYVARSEYNESLRASRSVGARAPLALASPLSSAPPPSLAAGGASRLHLASRASHCASLATLPLPHLQQISSHDVRAETQAMALCLPAANFGWRLRLAAYSSSTGSFTFAALHKALCLEPTLLAPPSAKAFYAKAMRAALRNADLAVRAEEDFELATELEEGEGESVGAGGGSASAPFYPSDAAASSSGVATAIAAAAVQHFAVQGFGSLHARAPRAAVPLSAQVYSRGLLPPLAPRRGCGRAAHDPERQQWTTVTGFGDDVVPISLPNQERILQAFRDLPEGVKVYYLAPQQLCERQSGVAHSSAKEAAALSAPKRRALCRMTLLNSAMGFVQVGDREDEMEEDAESASAACSYMSGE